MLHVCSVWIRAGAVSVAAAVAAAATAAGGNASEAEPTKVEVAKRIENWFGAGARRRGGVARRDAARHGVAWQLAKWGTIRFVAAGGGKLGSDK